VAKTKLADANFVPGTHGCTLGGNPLCAAAGAAVFKTIAKENLVQRSIDLGEKIVASLKAANIGKIKDIRGKGVMIGVELDVPGKPVFDACLENGVMLNVTAGNVVRLAPPMTIGEDELGKGLGVLILALKTL
jgi:acetylornithine/succinyldiaminopimelate/putrescine aminotransferase